MSAFQFVVFWLSAAAILLVPGALLVRRIPLLRDGIGFGEQLLPAFLLSAGLLAFDYLLALTVSPTLSFVIAAWAAGLLILLVWNITLARAPRAERRCCLPGAEGGGVLLGAIAIIAAAGIALTLEGGSLGYIHDSLDFVAFVRRMLLTDRIDLVSAAYEDVSGMTADPRRGAFHVGAAILCRLSGVAPDEMWRRLPAFLAPMALWTFFATFRRVLQSGALALGALVLLILSSYLNNDHFLNNLAYASRLGWVYSWVGLWAVALYLDAERWYGTPSDDWSPPHSRSRVERWVPCGLVMLGAPILLGVHLLSSLQYLVALGALCWSWAFLTAEPRPVRRTLGWLPLGALALLAPFLALQVSRSYSTANPLFDHPQGLLYLWDRIAILGPDPLINWFGWPGLVAIVLALPLARRFRESRRHAYLFGSTLAAALVVLNPLAVFWIERAHAHSVLFRVMWVVPIFQITAHGFGNAWRRARGGTGSRVYGGARERIVGLGVLAILIAAQCLQWREARGFWSHSAARRAAYAESEPLRRALTFLDSALTVPVTVASDPITSYQIPAYTRHYALSPFNQHSSPADARAAERIQDAHAILNAEMPIEESLRLLRKHRVRVVLLNQSFPRYVKLYYAFLSPLTFPRERARLEARPEIFERFYDRSGVSIYRFHDPGSGYVEAAPRPNPYCVVSARDARGKAAHDLAAFAGFVPLDDPLPVISGLELLGVDSSLVVERLLASVPRDSTIRIPTYWRRRGHEMVLPVESFIRVETAIPGGSSGGSPFGKLARALGEAGSHTTHRFGRYHQPLETWFPPFLWEEDAVYVDEFFLSIPPHAAPGRYRIGMKLLETPYTPNYDVGDFFRLDDSLEGTPIGSVDITH